MKGLSSITVRVSAAHLEEAERRARAVFERTEPASAEWPITVEPIETDRWEVTITRPE